MMNEQTTRSPTATFVTPGPVASTMPETSWPSTPGVGNATSPFRTWRSVWQTPHAATFTRTSCSCGSGMTSSSTVMGWLGWEKTAARMARTTC